MAKKLGLISPANLWGKPLPAVAPKKVPEKKVTGKMAHDEEVTDDEIDVDAELANADVEEADEEELHTIEAESDAEVTDVIDDGDPEEEEDAEDDEPDYDAEDGDVSDQTEDAVEDGEEVVTAVADNNEEETGDDNSPKNTRKVNMAEKMSLSDHVRAEIARRQKAGETPIRGKDIVDALAKRKLTVSPAQVSQLMKKAGLSGAPRGRREATATAATTDKARFAGKHAKRNVESAPAATKGRGATQFAAKTPAKTGSFRVPMDQLKAAESFVAACGGSFQSAERILTAAAQLSQTFSG